MKTIKEMLQFAFTSDNPLFILLAFIWGITLGGLTIAIIKALMVVIS